MLFVGDCRAWLRRFAAASVQCCVTSPPYWGLRDYGVEGQLGLEKTPEEYVANLVGVFREVRRVLRDDGMLWLNLGDSYATNRTYQVPSTKGGPKHSVSQAAGGSGSVVPPGLKPKDLVGIPWRVAFALQADGWYLRSDIIWHKPNPMPESVVDRPTRAHEYLFLLSKSERYFYDHEAVKEPAVAGHAAGNKNGYKRGECLTRQDQDGTLRGGPAGKLYETRNRRDVWTITTKPFKGAHFAVMPEDLVEPCILAGTRPGDAVLDPFTGAGTVWAVAARLGRTFRGVELNPAYAEMATARALAIP